MPAARISSTSVPLRGSLSIWYLLLGVSRAPSLYHLKSTQASKIVLSHTATNSQHHEIIVWSPWACDVPENPLAFLMGPSHSPDLRVWGTFKGAGHLSILPFHKGRGSNLVHKTWRHCRA